MHVAAALQPAKLARLEGAAGSQHRVLAALDWAHADAIIRRQPVDVLIVDPQFCGGSEGGTDRIRDVHARYRSLPMIVYSVLAAQTLRSLVELGRVGLAQLVLFGLDDDPNHLRHVLERQPGILLSEQLLSRLQRPLSSTPSSVGSSVERLIRNPAAVQDVSDLAVAAGVPRRTLYRHFHRAGLATPRELLAGAKLLRAYAFLREPSYTLQAVAAHVRFTDIHAMSKTMKWSVGMTPGRVRHRMGPEEFLDRLVSRLAPALGGEGGDEGGTDGVAAGAEQTTGDSGAAA